MSVMLWISAACAIALSVYLLIILLKPELLP
jgi:hypothetical protein